MTDDANAETLADLSGGGSLVKPPDRYVMRTVLGRGGMGEVWLARDVRIDRDIAIKLMRRDRSQGEDAVARFLREARVQGRLEHPSIVPVHDLGEQDAPYFAMKRLIGTTLADAIQDPAKWPRRALLARVVDVCQAIEFAHQRGVIHRDLKPANIMLGDYGETYVLDWGLARIAGDAEAIHTSDLTSGESGAGHTVAGEMLGTPGYMSPEQMRGDPIDGRTDVYALGCMLYEVLAGEPAVPRDRTLEVTLTAPFHRPSQLDGDVPPELDDVCAAATAALVDERIQSARVLGETIQQFLDGDRDLERRKTLAASHAERAAALPDDTAGRAEAMREAGRAIALDPANRSAQDTLARLLLTPPREIPAPVVARIEAERAATAVRVYRGGALAYFAFLVFVPVGVAIGIRGTPALLLICSELALLVLACTAGMRRPMVKSIAYAVLIGHGLLLATLGLLLGPLLLVPILVFGSLPVAIMLPVVKLPRLVIATHLLGFGIPLALELVHLAPSSFDVNGAGLVLHPVAVTIAPAAMLFTLAFTVVVQAFATMQILDAQRDSQDRAQEQLHVQAWQLAQLVPEK